MGEIWEALGAAVTLMLARDATLTEITSRSLQVSGTAVLIAAALGIPFAAWLAVTRWRGRRVMVAVMNALMGLPPVVVGLVVYLLLSRTGPFGVFNLLFTPGAMIIAQVIIVTPLVASIAHQALRTLWTEYHDFLVSLDTTTWQRVQTVIWDARRQLLTSVLAGFGRAIGEVGAIMIVGGNIDQLTRVLTTAISLETSKGNFELALALGIVLILLALGVSLLSHLISRPRKARLA
ncbi:MAG: ABC transporter permease [Pseudomonadota bacterium]